MTLNLSMPGQDNDLKPRITVFGVGGAGGNAVNNMIEKCLEGVDFVVANTDAQALAQSNAEERIQLGVKVTEGLGAGAKAAVGAAAAEENIEQIVDQLAGAHMCFITAGMGGGTGTGAAPIIAQAARELGVLTVGVVTKPFQFEGSKRMRQAEEGVEALQKMVDTLIIIPNQNLFRLANEKTTFTEAFSMADDVLYQGVKGVTDLMVRPGLINLDFADVRAVMDEMGKAMMGTGEDSGEERAVQAAEKAIANPLLDEISLRGARGVLINITGGYDLTLFELDEAANRIREEVDAEANIIVGSTLDPNMEGVMRVSVVATGIDANQEARDIPLPRRSLAEPLRIDTAPAQSEPPAADMPEPEQEVAAATIAEPAPDVAETEEPNLFDGFDPQAVADMSDEAEVATAEDV
ncbi:MAG: cell division protein FtsZ, partial [Pseudomonadota bacterium]